MQATVVERPLTHFVGIGATGSFDDLPELVPEARKALLSRQYEISAVVNPDEQLGVTRPQEHESGPDQVTTYIGFQVSAYINVPPNMIAIELPAGRYAQFVWQGSFESEAFQSFYPSMFNWFKEQSLTPSGVNPWIEIYGSDHDWEDRSNPANRLTVLMPIGGSALQ